jgi:acyl transferase domain-containing protein
LVHNIRSPVRFTDSTAALVKDGFRIFVEIGPNPVLKDTSTTLCAPPRPGEGAGDADRSRRTETRFRRWRRNAISPATTSQARAVRWGR